MHFLILTTFCFIVHSHAGSLWCFSLYGGLISERHSGRDIDVEHTIHTFKNRLVIHHLSLLFLSQLFDRLKLFGMPAKHQPDFIYLRHVPLRKVHLFTLTQLTCLVLLWVIKTSPAAIVFPMMV